MRVTQVVCSAGALDAVTNQALSWRAQFRRWGWGGRDFSARPPYAMSRKQMRTLREFQPRDGVVLVHYSGYGQGLERLFRSGTPTLLLSHNVTPEDWFWPHEPVEAVGCRLGREQLETLSGLADHLAGVSEFNAQELREITGREADVIPILFDRSALELADARRNGGPPGSPSRLDGSSSSADPGPMLLFVGRLAPHKRQDLVIHAFAEFRRRRPSARLTLVGHAVSRAYEQLLRELAERLAPGSVSFQTGLSAHQLAERYRTADLFLCLSEHEGFCIPLLEAFHFGVPVVARDAAAVGEVVGRAGVLLAPEDDPATVVELLDIVTSDRELQNELRQRGRARLEQFDQAATAERMRRALMALARA